MREHDFVSIPEKVKDAVPSFAKPHPKFVNPVFQKVGIGAFQKRSFFFQELNVCEHFGLCFFGKLSMKSLTGHRPLRSS